MLARVASRSVPGAVFGGRARVEERVREALADALRAGDLSQAPALDALGGAWFSVGAPAHPAFGDLTSDAALVLAKRLGRPAVPLAERLVARLRDPEGWFSQVEVGGPGFINFRLGEAFWRSVLREAIAGAELPAGDRPEPVALEVQRQDPRVPDRPLDAMRRSAVGIAVGRLVAAVGVASPAIVRVGPVRTFRRGAPSADTRTTAADEAGVRFALLCARPADPVDVDLDVAARRSTDNPLFLVRLAGARVGRIAEGTGGPSEAVDLTPVGRAEIPALRLLAALPEAVRVAAQAGEPQRVAASAMALAGAAHAYYNAVSKMEVDPATRVARSAFARCVHHALGEALDLLGLGT